MERINLLGYAQLPLIELLKEWGESLFALSNFCIGFIKIKSQTLSK